MELIITSKGNKYTVKDNKSRLLYSVKKKGFGSKFNLLDASNYILYTLEQVSDGRKPAFSITLNDSLFLKMICTSLFLDPTIEAEGRGMKYSLVSSDRMEFRILKDGNEVGKIKTLHDNNGDFQYEIEIENTAFDDYIPLFAVAIDKAFGDMNKK